MPASLRARLLAVLFAVAVLPSFGCGQIEVPVDLVLEQPSSLTLELPIMPPPYNEETTSLVGGVQTTIVANVGLFQLLGALVGKAIPAVIEIDDILIAGTEIVIGGSLPTGAICLFQDPDLASVGSAQMNVLLGVAAFDMTLNTRLGVSDPVLASLFGEPDPFTQVISAVVPLSIGDLLTMIGGGDSGLALTQDIETEIGPLPIFGTIRVTGSLTLASSDIPPSDPLLDTCEAFIASL
ncbi:hypothetical protein KJ059_17490 [Myxococcota bacterium]|nr:hypothetical protein [Myxococcota bacterium]MCZ7617680.1 hypothetical protein [Myxococcota bacterium]